MKGRLFFFLLLKTLKGLMFRGEKQIQGAVLALGLGLIPLLVVLVVADGMIQGITARSVETWNYHLQVSFPGGDVSTAMQVFHDSLGSDPEILSYREERRGLGLAYSESSRSGVSLRAVDLESLMEDPGFSRFLRVHEGEARFSNPDSLVIGRELAQTLGLSVGDQLRLLTARGSLGRAFVPRVSTFTIDGIVSVGYQDLDKLWVFMPLEAGVRLLPSPDHRSLVGLKITEPYGDLQELTGRLREQLPPGTRIQTWQDQLRSQTMNYQATRSLLLFIMFLILAVASVNISSTMVMIVMEQQKEIALLKTVGLGVGTLGSLYLSLGFLTGLMGTALGLVLGLGAALNINHIIGFLDTLWNILSFVPGFLSGQGTAGEAHQLLNTAYYLEEIPIVLDPGAVTAIALGSLLLSTLAAWVPSWRAARLKPLEILRKHG